MDCARNQSWHIDQLMIIVVGFVIPYDFFISDMCVCVCCKTAVGPKPHVEQASLSSSDSCVSSSLVSSSLLLDFLFLLFLFFLSFLFGFLSVSLSASESEFPESTASKRLSTTTSEVSEMVSESHTRKRRISWLRRLHVLTAMSR